MYKRLINKLVGNIIFFVIIIGILSYIGFSRIFKVLGIIIIIGIIFHTIKTLTSTAKKNQLLSNVRDICLDNLDTLARKKQQLTYSDDYGNIVVDEKKWQKELDYFINRVVLRDLPMCNQDKLYEAIQSSNFYESLDNYIDDYNEDKNYKTSFHADMQGLQYEHFCNDILKDQGWSSKVTKGTGDQGADILVDIDNFRIVIQCKRYSQPVSNKAIQEVYSAQNYYDAKYAAVVTNARYTTSARKLANKLNVHLLHHDDLENLAKILNIYTRTTSEARVSRNAISTQKLILNNFKKAFKNRNYSSALDEINNYIRSFPNSNVGYYYLAMTYNKINEKKLCLDNLITAANLGNQKARNLLENKNIEYN